MEILKSIWVEEAGANMVEYALMLFPLAITLIFAISFLSEAMQKAFNAVGQAVKQG
jgi:Flp pilus assembly pilin Flp